LARPSIFSREYERHRRRRKRAITAAVISVIAVIGVFIGSGDIKSFVANKKDYYKNIRLFSVFQREKKEDTSVGNVAKKADELEQNKAEASEAKEAEEKGFEVTLADGTKIKAVYEEKDGGNKFKYILPLNSPVSFNINPSRTAMVILDTQAQNLLLIDMKGSIKNITNPKYVYTKDDQTTVFNKDDVLKRYSDYNYIWCTSPNFIDDETVAYLSQLPHISSEVTKKFLWAVNVNNTDRHVYNYSMSGENLKFGNNTEKGLELVMDNGSIKYVRLAEDYIKVNE
jgi:hypothetical protein